MAPFPDPGSSPRTTVTSRAGQRAKRAGLLRDHVVLPVLTALQKVSSFLRLNRSYERMGFKGQTLAGQQPRRKGCGRSDGHKYWVNTDPMGTIMATIVWLVSISTFFLTDAYVITPWLGGWTFWGVFARLWIFTIDILNLTCHARAMLSNPGAVPKASKPVDANDYTRHCHKCDHFKPKRAHHCE
jgi:hypothetical protein